MRYIALKHTNYFILIGEEGEIAEKEDSMLEAIIEKAVGLYDPLRVIKYPTYLRLVD